MDNDSLLRGNVEYIRENGSIELSIPEASCKLQDFDCVFMDCALQSVLDKKFNNVFGDF